MSLRFHTLEGLLSALVGGTALVLAIVAGLFVYVMQYRHSAQESAEMVQSLVATVERSAAVAAFAGNIEIANDVVSGLLNNEVVASARLIGNNSTLAFRKRAGATEISGIQQYPIRSPFLSTEQVGTLEVGANADWVADRARQSALELVAWIFGLICLSALISMQIIRQVLSRNLARVTQQIGEIEPGSSARVQCPPLLQATEVGALIGTFNQLLDRIAVSIETERGLRVGVEESARELQATQLELMRSEKMAALGSLVEGVSLELSKPIDISLAVATTLVERSGEISKIAASGIKRSDLDGFIADAKCGADFLLRNVQRVSDFLKNFRSVAVEIRSEKPQVFDLRQIVEDTVATIREGRGDSAYAIVVDVPKDLTLLSYPDPLSQALSNLVENAIVHGFAGRSAGTVTVRGWRVDVHNVRISVGDNGCGIPAANLPRIFEPFFTTKFGIGGSGLGLYVVRNIVENVLGGGVRAESEDGKGTTLTLDIPMRARD
ncbi:hypothetical protein GCM10025771_30910 [Niveibacterium umoris]|uniref:histidine kinase n=1 Tax=Niveibacterium umoris TaxID=1193620 RepID=A0A840BMK4_9RHOO|nr:HAMP domain-containing sensor histidine kinase [Niveibacterium umoris]MBB4011717.1 signal transduction histidine kinase [Niveibacterium umoris]